MHSLSGGKAAINEKMAEDFNDGDLINGTDFEMSLYILHHRIDMSTHPLNPGRHSRLNMCGIEQTFTVVTVHML